jgi:hypothetical protein
MDGIHRPSWLVRYGLRMGTALSIVIMSSVFTSSGALAQENCPPVSSTYQASSLPITIPAECNLRGALIQDYGLGVVVGPPDTGSYAQALTLSGVEIFGVVTGTDGTVYLREVGDEVATELAATTQLDVASSPAACDDGYYNLAGWHENDLHLWYFARGTTPPELTADDATSALRAGVTNITHSDNDCGLTDEVSATSNYGGSTGRRAEVDSLGNCASFFGTDGYNVVDFGKLPSDRLGQTCTWYWPISNEVAEADTRLNKVSPIFWTVTPASPSCSNQYDVEGVATHEWGHVYGLAHVSEADHGNLTMSTQNNGPCQASERTLGLGDVLGLRAIY